MQKFAADALDGFTKEADERRTALVTREAELETLRLAALEAEHVLEVAQSAHFQADNEVRALEAEIARAKDQLEIIKVREISATRELEDVSAERQALRGEQERFKADLELQIQEEESAGEALLIEEERLQEVTARQQESERRLADLRRRASEIMSRIARAETSLGAFDRRKNEVEARREKLYGEREDLEGKQLELVARTDELRRNVDDLKSGKTSSKDERETLEKRLTELKSGVGESEKTLEQNKGDLHKARSRMQALLEVQSRLEGVGAGTRAVIHKRDPGVLGMLADLVEPPAELTQALAAAMGDHLQTLIVTDEAKAIELARWLRDEKKGRAVFLPRTGKHVGDARPALPAEIAGDSLGYFSDLVRFRAEDEEIVRAVLGDVVVAKDFEAAHRIASALAHRPHAIVTLEGEVLHADGRIAAGQKEQLAAGMLDSKRETRELSETVARLDTLVAELVAKHQALRASISETQTGLDAARQAEHRGEIALVGAEKDLRNAESELSRTRSRLEQVVGEIQDLAERIAEADQEQSAARVDLETAYGEKAALDSEGEDAQRDADSHREELEARRQVTTDKKIQVARAKEKTRSIEGALERLNRSAQELEIRETRLREELIAGAQRQSELGEFLGSSRDRLEGAIENAHNRREALTEAKGKHEEARAAMSLHEGDLKALRAAAEQSEKARMQQEMKLRELVIEMRNLLEGVAEKYRGLELPRIVGDYHLRDIPGEEHKARIHELQGLIDRLGSVNLDAKREFEEGESRYKVIGDQKIDLEKALADLAKAIEQMDRESKRLFKETFDAVNERFQLLFPKMFRGGRAHLVMTNPEDLLETGIDIVAQPPGKKIGNIELMSGGEKALTAVSLIFAMFQIRPSPFCILDEVDAPLDEANVARYNEAIRTMTDRSQFILITHIKRTMQMVDVLYGVTMPEPGVSALTSVDLTTVDKKVARGSHSAVA
jgi:chromosome segregation protein